jgi:SAM-dependent methyltransferase
VHQYGRALLNALERSARYRFEAASIGSLADLDAAAAAGDYAAILVNYHPQTLPFLDPAMPRRYRPPCLAVMHEMTQAEAGRMPRGLFQYYAMGDPTLKESGSVFPTGRILRPFENRAPAPARTTIGSFGFAVGSKGFERLIDAVQEEFDEAAIRIHVPPNGIIDADGALARAYLERCKRRLWKPGVTLEASHRFLEDAELMAFLAANTLNAFLYDYIAKAGISSVADLALAARRPVAVTRSVMFRHLHGLEPPITIEDTSLREIIANGTRPFERLLREWTPENACRRYEEILDKVCSEAFSGSTGVSPIPRPVRDAARASFSFAGRVVRAVRSRIVAPIARRAGFALKSAAAGLLRKAPERKFNRILDDAARIELAPVVRRMTRLAPGIVAKKLPRANVQQAFVLDAVEYFAQRSVSPRILCVGSFEDSAAAALQAAGHALEQIDPAVNRLDLGSFLRQPGTRKASYDIVFSTSVLEHVRDDGAFIEQLASLLAPGGIAVLTCDFMEGWRPGEPVIAGNYRFYTRRDLAQRLAARMADCDLVDAPAWSGGADFDLGGFRYAFATLVFRKRAPHASRAAWERLPPAEQARFFNDHGYLVIPGALSAPEVAEALGEIAAHGLQGTTEAIWGPRFTRRMVTNGKLLAALAAIFGKEVRFFKGAYVETPAGPSGTVPRRKALHVDYGIGEPEGDPRNSSASWVNVAFYLDDLTPERAPLWVVPGSNRDYGVVPATGLEHMAERAEMVLAHAGDAVLFHARTVHAASENASGEARHAFFLSYRPAWAKPVGTVPEWPEELVQSFPSEHRDMLRNLNGGL